MTIVRLPSVAYTVLADAHKQAPNGKVDAFGIFNRFLVWDTPTSRECSIILGLERMPAGKSRFKAFTRNPAGKVLEVGEFEIEAAVADESTMTAVRVQMEILTPGSHRLGIGPAGGSSRSIRWLPFAVDLLPWIELPTGGQLQALLADPHTLKAMRASLKCKKCGRGFTFEVSLDPALKRQRGVRGFPTNGKFRCTKCSTLHHLRDIEGQLRAHLSHQGQGAGK